MGRKEEELGGKRIMTADESILMDGKTGKPVIYKDKTLSDYPSTSDFKPIGKHGDPHPYCITPYHINNNPHFMYLGKEQIEQMETDIQHSLCGFGRTASGKYEKKGQTACNLLYAEHKGILIIRVSSTYAESSDGKGEQNELRLYVKQISERMERDDLVGLMFVLGDESDAE